jgi:hypothetical protein
MNPSGLSLHELLRYAICGLMLGIGFFYSGTATHSVPAFLKSTEGIGFSIVAFAAGAAFYSFYRSLLYPYCGRFALYFVLNPRPSLHWACFSPFSTPTAELERDKFRWEQREASKDGKPRLDEWASQVHLLYTSGFALWLGSFLGAVVFPGPASSSYSVDVKLFIGIIVLLSAAFVSDRRRRYVEEQLKGSIDSAAVRNKLLHTSAQEDEGIGP